MQHKNTYETLVQGVVSLVKNKKMPGAIIGISGTDSILTFLIVAEAFRRCGMQDRLIGVHFGKAFPPKGKSKAQIEKLLTMQPNFNWVAKDVMPWLQQQAPKAQLIIDETTEKNGERLSDQRRWAALIEKSLAGANPREPLDTSMNYWVFGTRNKTEEVLGTYSNISNAVSVQPLTKIWKSDVLKICKELGAPEIAIDQSRQVDCDCGRFDIAADHIEEIDLILKHREDKISEANLSSLVSPDLRKQLETFIDEQTKYAAFKKDIPYTL